MHSSKRTSAQSLTLKNVTVSFAGMVALDRITLTVEPGERLAVVGASGAGKTTLFRVLTRTVPLQGGQTIVGGRALYSLSKKELKSFDVGSAPSTRPTTSCRSSRSA
jgi:ABC-type transport system involved in cytochrome bd biosynthesis fused ATPase/permease subunit